MRFGLVAVLVVGALMLVGQSAEAQARGTVQASATVVDTRQGFEALSLVRQAVADSRIESAHTVATVAQVSRARAATDPRTLVLHRGITHSLAAACIEIVALTLLVGGGWRLLRPRTAPPWHWLAACIGAALVSHLYLDWQGSYGWRPFLPWSGTWYYLDWVAVVDPFFWLVPLVALAWGAERHWTPLATVFVVGSTITFFLVRAHDLVATWALV